MPFLHELPLFARTKLYLNQFIIAPKLTLRCQSQVTEPTSPSHTWRGNELHYLTFSNLKALNFAKQNLFSNLTTVLIHSLLKHKLSIFQLRVTMNFAIQLFWGHLV